MNKVQSLAPPGTERPEGIVLKGGLFAAGRALHYPWLLRVHIVILFVCLLVKHILLVRT